MLLTHRSKWINISSFLPLVATSLNCTLFSSWRKFLQIEQYLFKLTQNAFSFGPFASPDSLPLSGTPDRVTDKEEVKTAS